MNRKPKAKTRAKAKIKPIPDGFHSLTPYLIVRGCGEAIEFYQRAFGAKERYRFPGPDGKIAHAELKIGDSIFMMADEAPHFGSQSPQTLKGSAVGFVIYVKDADKAFQRAVDAGATVKQPLEDKFYGERAGTVEDPFGHNWTLMTHIENVSMKEMQKRMAEFCANMEGAQKAP
jgi:PhnB protein